MLNVFTMAWVKRVSGSVIVNKAIGHRGMMFTAEARGDPDFDRNGESILAGVAMKSL